MSSALTRLRLDVAYDGTEFCGWAVQPRLRTVQGTLEASLATVLRHAVGPLVVAGRTDAGVHARGQVCHLDVPPETLLDQPVERLAHRMSRLLPADVRVRLITVAPVGFDARFSALARRYAYRICDQPAVADPLERRATLWWRQPLDVQSMNAAAQDLLGEHDFAAFCRARAGATTIRTLRQFSWARADDLVLARVVADAFCHSMVRALVGCLLAVGEGSRPETWPADVLRSRKRNSRASVVAPHGLTLEEVTYPPDSELGARAAAARAVRTLS